MRALVVSPQPFFSPRGTPLSVYYRALVTAELGMEIDLLTYGQGQDVSIPGVRIVRIPDFPWLGPVRVGPSALKAFLDVFLVLWTVGLLLRRRYNYVHAHEEAVFWCRFLKPLFRFRLVYDMHSSLPQQLTNFRFTRSRLLIRAFSMLERSALKHADAVVTICPALRDYALASGVAPDRHILIENSIFEDIRLGPTTRQPARAGSEDPDLETALRSASGPIVAYAGTFEAYQGIDLLLSGFARVRQQRPDARLLLIGGQATQVAQKQRLARELGLVDGCIFAGQVSKTRAMELSGRAQVLVSPRVEGTNTPLKIYELLASGKPIVATRIRSHTQVLSDDVCILADPDPASIATGLLQAIDGAGSQEHIVRAKALYDRVYSRPAYEAKIRHLLEILP